MFPEHVETDRLHLRRFGETVDLWDAYDFHRRTPANERTMEYITQSPHETPKETRDRIDFDRDSWENGDGARYAIYPKDGEEGAGELAGATVLIPEWDKRMAYFGIRLRERFWGRGYSGERARALVALAFERLDLEVVTVAHLPGNDQSKRAIEKYVEAFGGQYDGFFRGMVAIDGEPRNVHNYSITDDQYEEHRPADLEVTFHD